MHRYRVREEELAYILHRLQQLDLDEGVFEAAFALEEDPVKALNEIEDGKSEFSNRLLHCVREMLMYRCLSQDPSH